MIVSVEATFCDRSNCHGFDQADAAYLEQVVYILPLLVKR